MTLFRRTASLGLLGLALCAIVLSGSTGDHEGIGLAMAGGNLSETDVRELESQVASAPDDVDARTQLLGYYFRRSYTSEEARSARQKHILWLIRNRPDAEILGTPFAQLDAILEGSAYAEGKKAWLEQVNRNPKSGSILGRAAAYSLLHDSTTAESLYKRAEAADPQNPEWSRQLGHLYSLGISTMAGKTREAAAKASLGAYERSLGIVTDVQEREALLPDVAAIALEAGDLGKARAFAEELLKARDQDGWNYGNMVHHGNLVLGRIALRDGDMAKAKQHLLAAGEMPGSPQLSSFGPNMSLAKELLEKGEKEAVLEYFKRCGTFWKRGEIQAWTQEVQAGKIPNFGANLDY